jgi:hypothetical protein
MSTPTNTAPTHTPGRYVATSSERGAYEIRTEAGSLVATIRPDYKHARANADLFAAAPELLKALAGLLKNQEDGWRATGTMPEEHIQQMPYLRSARAAIAKATGGAA